VLFRSADSAEAKRQADILLERHHDLKKLVEGSDATFRECTS
jgi:hypothetical protein